MKALLGLILYVISLPILFVGIVGIAVSIPLCMIVIGIVPLVIFAFMAQVGYHTMNLGGHMIQGIPYTTRFDDEGDEDDA